MKRVLCGVLSLIVCSQSASTLSAATKLSASDEKLVRMVQCEDNLRRIGLAITLYANDHNDKTPPDLGTLAASGDLDMTAFVCPSVANAVPNDWKEMKPEDRTAWVNAHTDYVYVSPGKAPMDLMTNPDAILAYDRDDDHGSDGMHVLFADSHVELFPIAAARKRFGKTVGTEHKTSRVAPAAGKFSQAPLMPLDQAKGLVVKDDINTYSIALHAFQLDVGRYPTTAEGLKALIQKPAKATGWKSAYIEKIRQDPWGHPYQYVSPGAGGEDFTVTSAGPDGKPSTADDIK